jgi:hypothetical protein
MDKVLLLFPYPKVAICKLPLSGILTLICLVSCFLCLSGGGAYGMGVGHSTSLLVFGILQAFWQGLEVRTHGTLPEWSLENETLKQQLGGES